MALLRQHIAFLRLVLVMMASTLLGACMTGRTQSLKPERFGSADSAIGQTDAAPASTAAWEIRVAALRSLQGRRVRVAGQEIGTMSGTAITMSDSAVVFKNSDRVAYVGIDSVWEWKTKAGTGFLIGGLIGGVIAVAVMKSSSCSGSLDACGGRGLLALGGGFLAGGLVGNFIGAPKGVWKLRFPPWVISRRMRLETPD